MHIKIYLILIPKGNKFSHSPNSFALCVKSQLILWYRDLSSYWAGLSSLLWGSWLKQSPSAVLTRISAHCAAHYHCTWSNTDFLQTNTLQQASFCIWACNKTITSFPGRSSISIPCFGKNFGIPP